MHNSRTCQRCPEQTVLLSTLQELQKAGLSEEELM